MMSTLLGMSVSDEHKRFFERSAQEYGFTAEQAHYLRNLMVGMLLTMRHLTDTDDDPLCPYCGSNHIQEVEIENATGVVAPNGGEERRSEKGIYCHWCQRKSAL